MGVGKEGRGCALHPGRREVLGTLTLARLQVGVCGGGTYSESVDCLVSCQESLLDLVRRWLQKKKLAKKQVSALSPGQCW